MPQNGNPVRTRKLINWQMSHCMYTWIGVTRGFDFHSSLWVHPDLSGFSRYSLHTLSPPNVHCTAHMSPHWLSCCACIQQRHNTYYYRNFTHLYVVESDWHVPQFQFIPFRQVRHNVLIQDPVLSTIRYWDQTNSVPYRVYIFLHTDLSSLQESMETVACCRYCITVPMTMITLQAGVMLGKLFEVLGRNSEVTFPMIIIHISGKTCSRYRVVLKTVSVAGWLCIIILEFLALDIIRLCGDPLPFFEAWGHRSKLTRFKKDEWTLRR